MSALQFGAVAWMGLCLAGLAVALAWLRRRQRVVVTT